MTKRFTVCVFCGSSLGRSKKFEDAALSLANILGQRGWGLVYGGGERGLMGILANDIVRRIGPHAVTGIIPRAMLVDDNLESRAVPQADKYGQTVVVSSMHERKMLMARRADAFVALPGGYGTIEELFEIITWNQLGIHSSPIVIFNINGFYDALLEWIDHAVAQGLIPQSQSQIFVVATTAQQVVELIDAYRPAPGRYALNWSKI